jgi:hypothetical protein
MPGPGIQSGAGSQSGYGSFAVSKSLHGLAASAEIALPTDVDSGLAAEAEKLTEGA